MAIEVVTAIYRFTKNWLKILNHLWKMSTSSKIFFDSHCISGMPVLNVYCSLLQLQVAYAKGLLKGKTAVESEAKKSFINNVVSIWNKLGHS